MNLEDEVIISLKTPLMFFFISEAANIINIIFDGSDLPLFFNNMDES